MEREKEKKLGIGIYKLMAARNCPKKGEYLSLGILDASEQSRCRKELLKMQGELLGDPESLEKVDAFIRKNVKREWYRMRAQYHVLLEEEAAYHHRLASFFVGRKRVAGYRKWSVSLALSFGGKQLDAVHGHVHAVLEEAGVYTAVVLSDGTPVYSIQARKQENRPDYAPELMGAYLGLRMEYGRNMKVCLVYLRRKEDSVRSEINPRQQIITVDFSSVSTKELEARMKAALCVSGEGPDCTTCAYLPLCSGMCLKEAPEGHAEQAEEKEEGPGCRPDFTESQMEVVNFKRGACAVYAVPGAGKTTTLVYRLCRLLESGTDPKEVLFVTFTNKAADEIRSRVKALLHAEAEEEIPDIYTYNGLGWQILIEHPELVGNLKLLTSMDERRILMECIEAFPETLKGYSYRYIEGKYGLLAHLKSCFKRLDEKPAQEAADLRFRNRDPEQMERLKRMYEERLKTERFITFDEQVTLAKELLAENPSICRAYGRRWRYIMADEFQDSNRDNVELLYNLADAGERNLVVVGDSDQSVYGWRNGSPRYLLDFPRHYPGCRQIYMNDNFRSARQILDASNHLIARNTNRLDMSMIAHKESKALPYRIECCGLSAIPAVLEMLRKSRYCYGDIAILSRTNAPLEKVKSILDKKGIASVSPSDLLIRDPFFILVKDILDLFYDGFTATDMAFYRFMTAYGVKLPEKKNWKRTFYENLVGYHSMTPIQPDNMKSMLEYTVEQERSHDLVFSAAKCLFQLFLRLESLREPVEIIDAVCYALQLDTEAPAVLAFKRRMEYQPFARLSDFREYIKWMAELGDDTKVEREICLEKVNLMTAHSSKGKEFPAVIILQSEDFKATEEERRLFYVAMTRAKKCLFALVSPHAECELLDEITEYVQAWTFA